MAADCKSAGVAYGGSNPSLPTVLLNGNWSVVKFNQLTI